MANSDILLPDYRGGGGTPSGRTLGRATASSLNQSQQRRAVMTGTALGEFVPIPYGQVRIPGDIIAGPVLDGSGNAVVAVGWGEGEIQGEHTIYINGQDMPGGVSVTHYAGTSGQSADPTLSSLIAGYGDAYADAAYSVFTIPAGTVSGFPGEHKFEAVLKGLLVEDVRTGTVAYSNNAGLCLADAITNTRYGLGRPVYGADAVADRADDLAADGFPRCQLNLLIDRPLAEPALLDMLTAHAECLWSYEGEGIRLVPDAPVNSAAVTLTADDVRGLRLEGKRGVQSPTVVSVTHTKTTVDATAWSTNTVEDAAPGVSTGELREERSDVQMLGVTREAEAARKARLRRRRLQYPIGYAWQGRDPGVALQKGDVVQLPDMLGLSSQWVRLLNKEQAGPGLYDYAAEHYSASIYVDDAPVGDTVAVPEGIVAPTLRSTAPAGWALFTDADGLLLRGEGDTTTHGDTGGDNTVTVAGDTSYDGAHSPEQDAFIRDTNGVQPGSYITKAQGNAPNHRHSYSGSGEVEPPWRSQRLVVKTGSSGTLPKDVGCWADGVLNDPGLAEHLDHVNRLVKAGAAATGGDDYQRDIPIDLSSQALHEHWQQTEQAASGTEFDAVDLYDLIEAGLHAHNGSVASLTFDVARTRLVQYMATADGVEVGPGQIYGYILDPANLSGTGYNLCDGTNGTIDLRDKFIELSAADNAGQNIGSNSGVSWSNDTVYDGKHGHGGSTTHTNAKRQAGGHVGDQANHRHSLSGSDPNWIPEHFVIRLVQYTGVV